MSDDHKTSWKLEIEAHGLTKGLAVSYALRLLAGMVDEPHGRGHSCGGDNGNASGNFTPHLPQTPDQQHEAERKKI